MIGMSMQVSRKVDSCIVDSLRHPIGSFWISIEWTPTPSVGFVYRYQTQISATHQWSWLTCTSGVLDQIPVLTSRTRTKHLFVRLLLIEYLGFYRSVLFFYFIRHCFWRWKYKLQRTCMPRKYWPQVCGADDRGKNVSWCPNYRESEPLFGHFTSHECLFGRNPDRPLLHASFWQCVMTVCIHPICIRDRRR